MGEDLSDNQELLLRFKAVNLTLKDKISVGLNETSLNNKLKWMPFKEKESPRAGIEVFYPFLQWEGKVGFPPAIKGENTITFELTQMWNGLQRENVNIREIEFIAQQ